jgi:glucose/arabinose dehydrogenase
VLRAGEGGKAATNEMFASGLRQPFGIAFFPNGDNPQWVYVANTDSVVRFPYQAGDLKARGRAETIVASLPQDGSHSTRDIVFTADNKRMLVSVGSLSNVAEGLGTPPGGLEAWSKAQPLGAAWPARRSAPPCWPSRPTARSGRFTPPASAIAWALQFSHRPVCPGARPTSATASATTSCPTTSPA